MKKEFIIYKEGRTAQKTVICSKEGEPFDRTAKIKKFLLLGYTVFDMNGKKITK